MARLLGGLSLLTAIGLYGVIAHSVGRRRREFEVRLALGEDPRRLRVSVLDSVWRLAGYGIVCGSIGAFDLLRVMKNEVFMVENGRWAVFAAMVLALLAVATVAGYFPA